MKEIKQLARWVWIQMRWRLRVLVTPSTWVRNYRACRDWDRLLNALLDHDRVDFARYESGSASPHYVNIGGVFVWVENYPYAYGSPAFGSTVVSAKDKKVLPSRRTVFRLKRAVDALRSELDERDPVKEELMRRGIQ